MKMLQVGLGKRSYYHRLKHRLQVGIIAFVAVLILVLSPVAAAQADADRPVKGTTSSDLSDIPNLEQMDYDTFEEYVGDVPGDRKPLFNPDNPKLQIKDKTPGSEKTVTSADFKEDKTDAPSTQPD